MQTELDVGHQFTPEQQRSRARARAWPQTRASRGVESVAPTAAVRPMPHVEPAATAALADERTRHASSSLADALTRDRARIRAILESPEAVGREVTARVIATTSGIEVHAARQMLQSMAFESEASAAEIDAFARKAASFVNPKLREQGS